jgi:D-alanyl-D-alanine carboxypeptidase/D-alanyl-D-alanine-endopeptidase (penicillin-binding protein 4)
MRRTLLWMLPLIAELAFALPVAAQDGAKLVSVVRRELREYEASEGARVGLAIADLATGRTLISWRPRESFTPASNQKLLTAAFALRELGPEFQFTTRVYRVKEDLLITGDGDPTLGDPWLAEQKDRSIYRELDAWARAVASSGDGGASVRQLLLASLFVPEPGRHPDWPENQARRWYAAPVSGLNFHNNCYDVRFRRVGGRVVPEVDPVSRFIDIENRIRSGKRHVWSLIGSDDESEILLRGRASQSSPDPLSVAVQSPPLLLGRVFADRLVRAGVPFGGGFQEVRLANGPRGDLLAQSETCLRTAIMRANKRSLNMVAECVFLRAGDGSWGGSAEEMTRMLVERMGLDGEGLVIRDGSGLSRHNRVSPENMLRVLTQMADGKAGEVFLDSLPISGVDGTLRNRMDEPGMSGRIRGKTGYVAGASCLSGYVLDGQQRPRLAFCVLANDFDPGDAWKAKRLQNEICRLLVRYLNGE